MKAGQRVQIIHELEPIEGFTFKGMTGTVKRTFADGAIIDIDKVFESTTALTDLLFEYTELEKI